MKKVRVLFLFLLGVILFYSIHSCTTTSQLAGTWREIGKKASFEFFRDGSFSFVDNMGMGIRGRYTLLENERVRFEIFRQGEGPEIVTGKLSVRGDDLTFSSEEGKEVERYRRIKKEGK